ncbi:PREDICTED: spectrin beta chain, non-erythrocytic 5-like, partial [Leptosomus discolor]|uniref:spectrin beta chain, non-erythrocytic 5-like n=1 Tax=Leptosomus discolor TaxID=188344 RepID=UPI000522C673
AWANEMHALVISEELANDVLGAELLIKRHEEYKREIEKQWLKYEEMQQAGGDLMKNGHFMSVEIEEKLLELSELMKKVKESWDMRKELYEENWEIQLLRRELEHAEAWLAAKESFLSDPSYGDSVSEVEELLKKQHDFEKMLAAQEEKFAQLSFFSRKTKREMNLPKQVDTEENEQKDKGKIVSASLQHMEGVLEKRDQLLSGRKQPGSRSWKAFYVKLDGSKLDFYNDEKEASKNVSMLLSLSISGAKCERLVNYIRKENAFMLRLRDGAEYFFAAPSQTLMEDWLRSLQNNIGHSNRSHSTVMVHSPNTETSQTKLWDFPDRDSAERPTSKSSLL